MTSWVFWGLAQAGISVVAPTDCLDAEAVQLEVSAAVDDDVFARLDLTVVVEGEQLTMLLYDQDRQLWSKVATVLPEDCVAVPRLVAVSVQQAVAELPRWVFRRGGWPPETSLSMHVAPLPLGASPRWELRGGRSGPISGRARWMVGLGVATEGLQPAGDFRASVVEALVRAGPALDLGSRKQGLRLGALLGLGPSLVVGATERASGQAWTAGVRVEGEATWLNPGPLRAGFVLGTAAVRLGVSDRQGRVAELSGVRFGLQVGVAHVGGDGGRPGRP